MKRLFTICAVLAIMLGTTKLWADSDRIIQFSQLPSSAQQLVKTHFPELGITLIKMDTDFLDKSYSVIFDNGSKIDFNKNGEWEEIKSSQGVPQGVIPAKIFSYIKEKYPEAKVLSIEIDDDSKEYEVKLSNRVSLEFNKHQQLIDIDTDQD
jgi:hypothetical protein